MNKNKRTSKAKLTVASMQKLMRSANGIKEMLGGPNDETIITQIGLADLASRRSALSRRR